MIEILCWLALVIVLAGCCLPRSPGKGTRHPTAPWVILYRDGSLRVDMEHPEWQKRFWAQVRRSGNSDGN